MVAINTLKLYRAYLVKIDAKLPKKVIGNNLINLLIDLRAFLNRKTLITYQATLVFLL